jgi:Asp-tRNA(Asn)/Glu-tRNA(Gln) amidotransferase A subunit family amidase
MCAARAIARPAKRNENCTNSIAQEGRFGSVLVSQDHEIDIVVDDERCFLSAIELGAAYRSRALKPSEVTAAVLRQIERVNPAINAFVTVVAEQALHAASESDCRFAAGCVLGPLDGIPLGIKDLSATAGIRTTRGSRVYEHDVPDHDAPVVERMKRAGAVILGKTNTPEFGWKSPTDNPLFGPTRNPWNLERTAAGSSGGSAAAVACGMGPLASGGDGGGSIRQPASFCGVFGIKPTFGLVPMFPRSVVSTFASEGPLSRSVRDGALMLNAMAGYDPRDLFSKPDQNADFVTACDGGIAGLRVAWSPDLGYAQVDPEVRAITENAALRFAELGAHVEEATPGWPDPYELFHTLFYALVGGTVDELLGEWQGRLDPGLERIADAGRKLSAFDVSRAQVIRNDLQLTGAAFFERFDLLLTPTMTLPPFPVGIDFPPEVGGKPVTGMQWTAFTFPFNLTGDPAASVPAGWTADGLPIGLQIVGPRWHDARVLRAAAAFEAIRPWSGKRPPVLARASTA